MISFADYLLTFTDIPSDSLEALLNLFKLKSLAKDEFYAREARVARKLAFLEEGLMRAFYRNDKGEEFNKTFFHNPAIVGAYSSLITKEVSMINIQCMTDCKIVEANFDDIVALYPEHRSIETLNRKIAEDFFVQKEKREMSLVMIDAAERYENFKEKFPTLENEIPQYQVASYLGITAVQLSRIRAKRR
ncbi:MAG: Crp/Fnr family transcriptional regulator [Bacteroidota bacterium]